MTLFRNTFNITSNILSNKKCFVFNKSIWSPETYFGTKIEVPLPPKRPLSAYMIFVKEQRKDILKENPYLKNTEQIKLLAKKWSGLSEDKKKPYELSARESTMLYSELHKKYYENLTEEQKQELSRMKTERLESRRTSRLKKELRASGLPSPAKSAYVLFIQDEAKNRPVVETASDFIKNTAQMWKNLPEHTKRVYEIRAEEEKTRYALEMKDWRAKMISEGKEKLLQAFDGLKRKAIDPEKVSLKKKTAEKSTKEVSKVSKKK